jgi:hypothetical protein
MQVQLKYGTIHTHILTMRDAAIAIYGTIDSPSIELTHVCVSIIMLLMAPVSTYLY